MAHSGVALKLSFANNPSEIVKLLLSGDDVHAKGLRIDYEPLVGMLSSLKEGLLKEIEERERVWITIDGVPPHHNRVIREIYDSLEKSGEMELAARFRDASSDLNVVKMLKKALEEGRLIDEARKLLSQRRESKPIERKPIKLKRICWCVITVKQ